MKKTAKAAVYTGINKPFEIKEFDVTKPEAGMVSLSLVASGICGTDRHILSGRILIEPEKIIGHEFIGRVEEIGDAVTKLKIGDYVISDIACPCGKCTLCKEGNDANCVNMSVTNGGNPDDEPHFFGGYAEMCYAPAQNLIRIPDGINPKVAAVYACAGPTSLHAFYSGQKTGWNEKTTKFAVVQGTGPVGTFAIMYLKSLGIKHIAVVSMNLTPERIEELKATGATEVFDLAVTENSLIRNKILELTDGLGADMVYEASGAADAVPFGMSLLRNCGFYLIPGQYSDRGLISIPTHQITFNALRLIGSSQYSVSDVEKYLEFLEENPNLHDQILSVVTEYPLEKVNEAFSDLEKGKIVKGMLVK